MNHLRDECGGNVHTKGVVSITSSGSNHNLIEIPTPVSVQAAKRYHAYNGDVLNLLFVQTI